MLERLKQRKAIIEHVFGTIKKVWGYYALLTKGIVNVAGRTRPYESHLQYPKNIEYRRNKKADGASAAWVTFSQILLGTQGIQRNG